MAQRTWGFCLRTDRNKAVVAVVTKEPVKRPSMKRRGALREEGSLPPPVEWIAQMLRAGAD